MTSIDFEKSANCPCRGSSRDCPFCEGTGFWINRKARPIRARWRKQRAITGPEQTDLEKLPIDFREEIRAAMKACADSLPNRVRSVVANDDYDLQVLINMLHDDSEAGFHPKKPADFFLKFTRKP